MESGGTVFAPPTQIYHPPSAGHSKFMGGLVPGVEQVDDEVSRAVIEHKVKIMFNGFN